MTEATIDQVKEGKRRRARMAAEARNQKYVRPLVTPEGAVLNLRIATAGERAGAFLLDFTIQILTILAVIFGIATLASAMGFRGWQVAWAVVTVLVFFIRNFYFIAFEIGRKAATPGKRALGLRVAARDGGRLKANAVIARNFLRELEVFLPLQALFGLGGGDLNGWLNLLLLIWAGIFLLFPLFNKDKLRVGDLVAGTMVIHAPKVQLLKDVVSVAPLSETSAALSFTPAQLDVYGIHELHVLEDVLRQSTPEIKKDVADRIIGKIGWDRASGETDVAFLEAFYAALRKHLEQRMLFGERKADKYDRNA